MLKTQNVEYFDGKQPLEAHVAYHDNFTDKKPAVLIAHDWSGRNEFANKKAEKMAELGYVGVAIDMYGKNKTGKTTEEKSALMQPLIKNRAMLIHRMNTSLDFVKQLPNVDTNRIAAIGFCFGGLCALDLARSGAELRGVVSFHGILSPPNQSQKLPIKAKILVLHGHEDPMAPPEQVLAFEKEMTEANVDWQIHIYSQTQHAFTNPEANDPKSGLVYNKIIAERAWIAMKNFFVEIFA